MRLSFNGFKYVHVEEDGTVRELNREEKDYLQEEFHPNDGARPYIKTNYWERTPNKKLHGFLKRSRVPWWIKIEADKTKTTLIKGSKLDASSRIWTSNNDPFDDLAPK